MGDFSVKAVLSAVDKNFSSTMKSALGYTNNLKSTLTSGFGFGAIMGAGQAAFSAVSGSVRNLASETIDTSDSMQKLQQAMRFSGSSEAEIQRIAGATGTLKTYADKTVFSLQDVMSTFGALSANGIKDADKMTESVGNAVAVFGGGAREFSAVGLAYSQAMAAGALHAQDWNQILNASPQLAGGLKKELIKLNPVLGEDFKQAMEDGAISADLLGQAMNNIGMTDLAKEAATSVTTFEGAMGNLQATVTSGMMGLYETYAKSSVVDAINGFNDKVGAGFDWLSANIPKAIESVKPYFYILKNAGLQLKAAFGPAIKDVREEIGALTGSLNNTGNISAFWGVILDGTSALKTFAKFLQENDKIVAKALVALPKLVVAYKGLKIVKAVAPFVGMFTSAIGGLAKFGLDKISSKLFGVSKAQDAVGKSSGGSSKKMLASAKAFMMVGAGVLLISTGFYLLAQSAVAVANAGPMAIATMAGMVVAVGALLLVAKSVAPALTAGAVGFVAFGAAVILAGAGMMLLTTAAINLANAGPLAIGVMAGMVLAIAGLALGAAALGPALTAGAVGFIAFGAAIVLVGVGAVIAAAALMMVSAVLPTIVTYGTQGAVSIAALGASMLVFAVGATAAGAACIVLGAGLVIAGAGIVVFGAGVVVAAAGMIVLAASLKLVNSSMKSIASNAKTANSSIKSMVGAVDVVNAGLDALGNKAKSAVNKMISIFSGASGKATSAATTMMTGYNSGISAGGVMAVATTRSMTNSIVASLGSARSGAYSSGYYIGAGLASGMASTLGYVRSVAAQLAAAADEAIRAKAKIHSPSRVAEKDGEYLGEGWVGGILSKVKDARNAAKQLVQLPKLQRYDEMELQFAGTGGMTLNDNYDYNSEYKVQIEVPLSIEGREVAKATAKYDKEEQEKLQKMSNRIKGIR